MARPTGFGRALTAYRIAGQQAAACRRRRSLRLTGRAQRRGLPVRWALSGCDPIGLEGQGHPIGVRRGDLDPAPHGSVRAWVERLAQTLADELGHPRLVELEDQPAVGRHPERCAVEHQSPHGPGFALHERETWHLRECLGHRDKAWVCGIKSRALRAGRSGHASTLANDAPALLATPSPEAVRDPRFGARRSPQGRPLRRGQVRPTPVSTLRSALRRLARWTCRTAPSASPGQPALTSGLQPGH